MGPYHGAMAKNENKKPKTVFTVYNIESGEEYTFTNFNGWAKSVGESVNTRSRFNDMCNSTTVQYRGKYILKDKKFIKPHICSRTKIYDQYLDILI